MTANSTFLRFLPALTFLLGAVLGGVVIGVGLGVGDSSGSDPEGAGAAAAPTTTASSDTTVVVPAACSEVAATVTRVLELVRQGVGAVRDFQPTVLTDVLDQLETLDPQLRAAAEQCSAVQVNPGEPTGSPAVSPSGSPSP